MAWQLGFFLFNICVETELRKADRVQFLQAFAFADQNLPGSGIQGVSEKRL